MRISDLLAAWRERRQLRRVFVEIHDARSWGGEESSSGPGSTRERAAAFLPDLLDLVATLRVSTLLDAPCGDFNWAQPLADAVPSYVGVDIVPALIAANNERWSSPRRRFVCCDFVHDRLPEADLVFCRDALVHLAARDVWKAVDNFRRTRAEYFVVTTFAGDRDNADIRAGEWRPLNMQRPPFDFPEPLALVDERCHHSGGAYADKRLGLWRFADLPQAPRR